MERVFIFPRSHHKICSVWFGFLCFRIWVGLKKGIKSMECSKFIIKQRLRTGVLSILNFAWVFAINPFPGCLVNWCFLFGPIMRAKPLRGLANLIFFTREPGDEYYLVFRHDFHLGDDFTFQSGWSDDGSSGLVLWFEAAKTFARNSCSNAQAEAEADSGTWLPIGMRTTSSREWFTEIGGESIIKIMISFLGSTPMTPRPWRLPIDCNRRTRMSLLLRILAWGRHPRVKCSMKLLLLFARKKLSRSFLWNFSSPRFRRHHSSLGP